MSRLDLLEHACEMFLVRDLQVCFVPIGELLKRADLA
jgi:hypothetical protein